MEWGLGMVEIYAGNIYLQINPAQPMRRRSREENFKSQGLAAGLSRLAMGAIVSSFELASRLSAVVSVLAD